VLRPYIICGISIWRLGGMRYWSRRAAIGSTWVARRAGM